MWQNRINKSNVFITKLEQKIFVIFSNSLGNVLLLFKLLRAFFVCPYFWVELTIRFGQRYERKKREKKKKKRYASDRKTMNGLGETSKKWLGRKFRKTFFINKRSILT